ncbi:amyloid fiber anchoring/assembly protein TapA [Bacillus haikouensis]|nr:amyloid fiber anchoring/assembly protein TapA [Bacillus haikouensis]
MIPIRYPRTKKHKTPFKKWKLLCQLMAIWYAITITGSYIDGSTGAYFNDQDQVTGVITAGTWSSWDKSSLEFVSKKQTQSVTSCPPIEISATVINKGSTMEGKTEYAVYYAAKGNPKDGKVIFEGDIQPITKGENTTLKTAASEPGNYKFKALQRPGHGNKEDIRHELWSDTITITCDEDSAEDKDKGGGKEKPEPPKKEDKQEKQEVKGSEEVKPDQSNKEDKKDPAPPVEEKPEPEQPAAVEPEPEVKQQEKPQEKTEPKAASEPKPAAQQIKKEEPAEPAAEVEENVQE